MKTVTNDNLRHGNVQSCGHLKQEMLVARNKRSSPSRRYQDPTTSARNTVIYNYRKAARARGITWRLSTKDCVRLFQRACFYCGAPPSNVCQMYGGTRKPLPPYTYNGIDRKDPKRGYIKENTVTCCARCNRAKFKMTVKEFITWVRRVCHHRIQRPPRSR